MELSRPDRFGRTVDQHPLGSHSDTYECCVAKVLACQALHEVGERAIKDVDVNAYNRRSARQADTRCGMRPRPVQDSLLRWELLAKLLPSGDDRPLIAGNRW